MHRPFILCAGELLIDLISTDYAEDFRSADSYRRFAGGSPANLAVNLALLGQPVALLASVGEDDAGTLLLEQLKQRGVSTDCVRRVALPTTLILVTKSRKVSNFEAYRGADSEIVREQIPEGKLGDCGLFHTTAFALSRQPARAAILETAATVARQHGTVSIDANYADKIWPDRREARDVIGRYLLCSQGGSGLSLAKFSDVDYHRLFAEPVADREAALKRIHALGADVVCLTLGEEGCWVSDGEHVFSLPPRRVEVQDTTGAGDAFWSGFLAAHVNGYDWEACARAGRGVAERKLVTVGPMRDRMVLEEMLDGTESAE